MLVEVLITCTPLKCIIQDTALGSGLDLYFSLIVMHSLQMPCEEHGFFLEIAQVIRNLELTILKGVMEKRSDKTWAHFIVEVMAKIAAMLLNIFVEV